MHIIRKHIGLLFLFVFSFPLIYKSVHDIQHGTENENTTVCCDHHSCTTSNNNTEEDSKGLGLSEYIEKTVCPICEYQFSINDIPYIHTFTASVAINSSIHYSAVSQQQYKPVTLSTSPRGPPHTFL